MSFYFRFLLVNTLFFSTFWLNAQTSFTFSSLKSDTEAEQKLLNSLEERFNKDVSTLTGTNKKYVADLFKERFVSIKEKVLTHEVLSATEAQNYLNALVNEIVKSNPTINRTELRIAFSKSHYANASSMGEGTILFNIGLFHRLQNESQAAFVLCHELAHFYLAHSNINIQQYVNTVYSDAYQKQLKAIQKSEFNKNSQLEALGKNLLFRSRRHSRQFEQAADSMALELLKNTAFDVNEALTCLQLLDSADKEKYNSPLLLQDRFNFPDFPFKKRWLQSDELVFIESTDTKQTKEEDSLKTHPDCQLRIEALRKKTIAYYKPSSKSFVVDSIKFRQLQKQFDYETIQHCFDNKQVSRSFYLVLKMLPSFPNDPYLNTMVGRCLNEFYAYQKEHQLSKVADLPSADKESDYNELLHMLQNLRLHELATLSFQYLKQQEGNLVSHKDFQEVYKRSKEHYNQP